ncbi:MAG: nitroreductase family protein [Lachnospiraceae bacterium]|nr:nitroreductase family protein [Lachnospiraceae bacterium]
MDILEIMKARHSVRQYTPRKIEDEKRRVLDELATACNKKSGLNIQMIYDEPRCFSSIMAHYGKFSGCSNYIAIVGKKDKHLEEKAGYYGEKIVLKAQELGLNTCWAAMTHGKSAARIEQGEKLVILIALGYGANQGTIHKNKKLQDVCNYSDRMPEWFRQGMEAVMLAPTAINQQRFKFTLDGDRVSVISTGGPCSKIDLGIVKYHFEAVSKHKAYMNP